MGLVSRLLGNASDLTQEQTREELDGILLPEESVEVAFKLIRDLFVFTDRRLILVGAEDLDLWPDGSDPENVEARR